MNNITNPSHKASDLIIAGTKIRQDSEGRYCLNDCHKASGGEKKNGPSYWVNNEQSIDLIKEITDTGIPVSPVSIVKGGIEQGTYVVKELVYAYAMWISPAFHLQVIRAYDDLMQENYQLVQTGGYMMPPNQLGGIAKSVVKKALIPLFEEINALRKELQAVKDSYDPSGAFVTNYKPMIAALIKLGVPSKGRRGLVLKCSARCNKFLVQTGKNNMIRISRETGRYMYHIDGISEWLRSEGQNIIFSHIDKIAGQGRLHLVTPTQMDWSM